MLEDDLTDVIEAMEAVEWNAVPNITITEAATLNQKFVNARQRVQGRYCTCEADVEAKPHPNEEHEVDRHCPVCGGEA